MPAAPSPPALARLSLLTHETGLPEISGRPVRDLLTTVGDMFASNCASRMKRQGSGGRWKKMLTAFELKNRPPSAPTHWLEENEKGKGKPKIEEDGNFV